MDIQYGNLDQLRWLLAVVVCVVVYLIAGFSLRRNRQRFATSNLIDRVVPPVSVGREIATAALVVLSLVLMIVALLDIRWGRVWREIPQQGIEIVFVLDVSRSMLAEDVTPNRLARAKQQIVDTVDTLAGDRVALVVFAGEAKQQIPMTSHYDEFKFGLKEVGPRSLARGGSRLGDAIRTAADSFLTKTNNHKAMIILTDGEDHESKPVKAARNAFEEQGVQIFTVGLGDFELGARIPVRDQQGHQYLEHQGQPVWTKLNGKILTQVATVTGGAYIPAGTKQVNMTEVYQRYVANIEKKNFQSAKINRYEARFQWFLFPALILLVTECWLASSSHRRLQSAESPRKGLQQQ